MKKQKTVQKPLVININVTAKHILAGKPQSSNKCAVALALAEQTDAKSIHVSDSEILMNSQNYKTPKKVSTFVVKFDEVTAPVPLSSYHERDATKDEILARKKKLKPFSFSMVLTPL